MATYKIIRMFFNSNKKRTLRTGVSLEEAREHCSSKETSYKTCTSAAGKARTRKYGPWFDAYDKE